MKTVKVIARDRIINPATGERYDDEGLRALNGYFEDYFHLKEPYNEIALVNEIRTKYPKTEYWDFEIIPI